MGTSQKTGGDTYYSFNDPVSEYSFNLGDGTDFTAFTPPTVPFDRYTTNGELLYDYCKNIPSSEYPEFTKRGNELSAECLEKECPDASCDFPEFYNKLNVCFETGANQAFEEIKNICLKKQAEIYVEKVKIANSLTPVTESSDRQETSITIHDQSPKFCDVGYTLSLDKTNCIKIPEHAHAVNSLTDVWLCDEGYREVNEHCVEGYQRLFDDNGQEINNNYSTTTEEMTSDEITEVKEPEKNDTVVMERGNKSGSVIKSVKQFFRKLFLKLSDLFI